MTNKKILVTCSSMPPLKEYINEISSLWESHWLTNMGEKHQKFETNLKEYLGIDNIALFTNGHSALECILEAMNLKGEVITTPFTFVSTTHAIVRKGLTPVFADIKRSDCTIDPDSIEALITPNTCAILPVHVYGNLCDVDRIQDIANRYSLKVIYDAAHAFGVRKNGISAAAFGDAAMFSFHATKVFNTIEGGAVCFKDPSLKRTLSYWKNFGITGSESVEYIGGNAKMNEFCAAMGICNLRHLESEIEKRKTLVEQYKIRLENISGITLLDTPEGITNNYAYMPIIVEDEHDKTRDQLFDHLAKHNIFSRKYFYPLTTDYDCYKNKYSSAQTPVAKDVANRVLTLPLYADLSLENINHICDIIEFR